MTSSLDDVTGRRVQKRYTVDFETLGPKLTFKNIKFKVTKKR